ncbi:uncharacterized protein LOC109521856 [Hippocampus comes]|uniref:Uncharacterized LOC109521856 n=1 Tax=Hippocampus comes TaxID=109280 RepID=A0A3Q2X7B8_HIPCM|nr:PREDICTED: uncharacterized protein LOC109521856 [Hippocampus comes]
MLVFSWLMWIFYYSPAVGGPVQHMTWSEEANPVVQEDESARSSFYHLPVFLHASQPLVVKELLRPAPRQSFVPAEVTALLFPQSPQHPSTPQAPRTRPVEVWCGPSEIVVRVDRLQLRAWPHAALYSLGSCQPTTVSSHFLFFHYALPDCASASQVVAGGQLVYSFALYYTPPPQGYIIRVLPFKLSIHCFYNRFHYSYQVGYTPQVQHTTFMKSLRTKLSFSLTVCNAQWEPLSPGHSFVLGEPVKFVAQTGSPLAGERLFVDSCYVTNSKDPNGMTKVDIITNYGCMTDSQREGSSSHFWSRSRNMLKFSIDAFLFSDVSQVLYLHCSMSVGVTTSHTSKSCNYNQTTGRWEELEVPMSLCSCCDSVCGDMQDSVKNMVSSAGWITRQKDDGGLNMKDSPVHLEAEEKLLDQEVHRVHFQKLGTFPLATKTEHKKREESVGEKTSMYLDGEEALRPRTAISMLNKSGNRGLVEKDLMTDGQKTEPTPDGTIILDHSTQDVSESREGATYADSDSMRGSGNNSTVTPESASTTTTSILQNSNVVGDLDYAEKVSTDLIPSAELCLYIDKKSCLSKDGTVKVGKGNTSVEHADPIRTSASKTTRLMLKAGEESANSSAKTDSSELDDSESVGRQLERIPEQVVYYVDGKGLDGGDMLQSLQVREWESDPAVKLRGPACVDGSDCSSGIEEDEALQRGQFAIAAKTKKVEDKNSDVTSGSTSSQEVLDNSHHSAVIIVTNTVQENKHFGIDDWLTK